MKTLDDLRRPRRGTATEGVVELDDPSAHGSRWSFNRAALFAALLGLAGLVTIMYPSTAAWWSQHHQSQAIDVYNEAVRADRDPGNVEQLAAARAYNQRVSAGEVVVGEGSRKPTSASPDSGGDYERLLDAGDGLMARLRIEKIGVDLPVYHGTSDDTLLRGVGHLEGTSLPVGGEGTQAVLTGHRGLASATMFNDLDQLVSGDTFTIEVMGEVLTYRVFETRVIQPEETETLLPRAGEDLVTLVTCTPLGINTHRILVTAERVTPTPVTDVEDAGKTPDIPGFPWWSVILPGGILLSVAFVWWSGRVPRALPQ